MYCMYVLYIQILFAQNKVQAKNTAKALKSNMFKCKVVDKKIQ